MYFNCFFSFVYSIVCFFCLISLLMKSDLLFKMSAQLLFFFCSIEWWSYILLEFLFIMLVIHSVFLLSWNTVDFCDSTWWLFDVLLLADKFFIFLIFQQLLAFLYHEHYIIVSLMLVFMHSMQLIIFILLHLFVVVMLS